MRIEWIDDEAPPPPQGVIAFGATASALLARLAPSLETPDTPTPSWRATAHRQALIVLGRPDTLPWLDGVRYIAPRPEAPLLWLPTDRRPSVPLDLLSLAATRRHARIPMLLWPAPAQLLPLDRARPLDAMLASRIRTCWSAAP